MSTVVTVCVYSSLAAHSGACIERTPGELLQWYSPWCWSQPERVWLWAHQDRPPPLLPAWRVSCQMGKNRGGRSCGGSIFNRCLHYLLMSRCLVRPGVLFNVWWTLLSGDLSHTPRPTFYITDTDLGGMVGGRHGPTGRDWGVVCDLMGVQTWGYPLSWRRVVHTEEGWQQATLRFLFLPALRGKQHFMAGHQLSYGPRYLIRKLI